MEYLNERITKTTQTTQVKAKLKYLLENPNFEIPDSILGKYCETEYDITSETRSITRSCSSISLSSCTTLSQMSNPASPIPIIRKRGKQREIPSRGRKSQMSNRSSTTSVSMSSDDGGQFFYKTQIENGSLPSSRFSEESFSSDITSQNSNWVTPKKKNGNKKEEKRAPPKTMLVQKSRKDRNNTNTKKPGKIKRKGTISNFISNLTSVFKKKKKNNSKTRQKKMNRKLNKFLKERGKY